MAGYEKQHASRNGVTQIISYTTTTAITNAFGSETYQIRIASNAACHYHIYDTTGSATATTSDPYLPANFIEYVTVSPGQKISAVQDVGAGILYVTELS
jgi:hypothetical protein